MDSSQYRRRRKTKALWRVIGSPTRPLAGPINRFNGRRALRLAIDPRLTHVEFRFPTTWE
jgi:hypothetical protein